MIIPLKNGGQIVLGECLWIPGVYISVGNVRGSHGTIMEPDELDQVRAELERIAGVIADREAKKRKKAA